MKKTILLLSFLIGILSYNIDVEAKEHNYFSNGNGSGGGSKICFDTFVVGSNLYAVNCNNCNVTRCNKALDESTCN